MSEASHPAERLAIEKAPEASLPSPRELMRFAGNGLRSDEGIVASGIVGGAAVGTGVAIFVEGMPTAPTQAQEQIALKGSQENDGSPPMVEATQLQEGTIAGMLVLGTLAGVAYTRARRRMNERATPLI
jgi:hypothetical protein